MTTSPLSVVIQHLLADLRPDGAGTTDGELLARFLRSRDEDALAALVRRHAPMVWGVCCRLLHHHHDAEDAFQATFLVLVRKAADVPRQAVANWLYGVARQTAVRLRATAAKRGRRESQVVNMPEPTVAEVRDADWQPVLDEELSRLPDHYRGVIVLCDLEGMTRKEAARQLGIPEGSVASRLARARVMLAKRLTQRGVVFSGGLVAAVLSAGSASASAPPALVASTIKAASLLAAGRAAGVISAKVAALTEGVVKTMFVTKIKSVLAVVLVVGLALGGIGTGIGLSTNPVAVAQQPSTGSDDAKNPDDKEKPKPGNNKQAKNLAFSRVRLVELDAKASVMTADVVSDRANDAAKATGIKPHTVRLMNLPIAADATITAGKRNLKLSDLKAGNVLLLLLVGEGDAAVVKAIQVEGKVWTIEEALTQLPREKITVEFEVGKAGKVWATGATLGAAFDKKQKDVSGPLTLFPAGPAADKFYVMIYNLDEARLKALGLSKADEFVGKRVRVTGQVDVTSRPARPNTTGRIIVWSPDEIELLK
jgi:RNA polymerase sigma factor (sigma-70 family)